MKHETLINEDYRFKRSLSFMLQNKSLRSVTYRAYDAQFYREQRSIDGLRSSGGTLMHDLKMINISAY